MWRPVNQGDKFSVPVPSIQQLKERHRILAILTLQKGEKTGVTQQLLVCGNSTVQWGTHHQFLDQGLTLLPGKDSPRLLPLLWAPDSTFWWAFFFPMKCLVFAVEWFFSICFLPKVMGIQSSLSFCIVSIPLNPRRSNSFKVLWVFNELIYNPVYQIEATQTHFSR